MSGLVKSIYRNIKNVGRISSLQERIFEVARYNESLQAQVEHRQSEAYLESEARDRLGMVKEGEVVVIMLDADEEYVGEEASVLGGRNSVPVWQQWRFIFLGY